MLSLQQVQLIALIVLGFYKSVVQAQVVGLGTGCPSMDAVTDFKLQQVGQKYLFFLSPVFVLKSPSELSS